MSPDNENDSEGTVHQISEGPTIRVDKGSLASLEKKLKRLINLIDFGRDRIQDDPEDEALAEYLDTLHEKAQASLAQIEHIQRKK